MNPIHIVDHSPWPVLVSITAVTLLISSNIENVLLLILLIFQWFRDIIREGKGGYHTIKVQKGLTIGYILFLISEIMLFFSFFWAFFHSSLSPAVELAIIWPPLGIDVVDYTSIPLFGSITLLASGFFVTLSHHAFIQGNKSLSLSTGVITVL
jgi:cytochrome c oxidase subunit 3